METRQCKLKLHICEIGEEESERNLSLKAWTYLLRNACTWRRGKYLVPQSSFLLIRQWRKMGVHTAVTGILEEMGLSFKWFL